MTKEQCSLQPNYYGSSCDFQDLQSAVQQLTTKSDAQFEELKNEKWFHRMKSKNVVSIIVLGHVRDCLDRRWFPIVSL